MLGIIGAMDIEVNGIIEKMEKPERKTVSGITFTSGTISGTACVIAKCGIGKVNAAICTQTMILLYSPDRIINTGVGGATSDKTHIGSVVIADRVVQHDFDTTALGDETGTLFLPDENRIYLPCSEKLCGELENACASLDDIDYTVVTIATGDRFISETEDRRLLNTRFNALACEMEGGSIGHVCYVNKIPFCILRSISDDNSGGEGSHVEYAVFAKSAADKAVEIITAYINACPED